MSYKFLPHTADVKVLVESGTLANAFRDSYKALKETIVGKIKIEDLVEKEIKIMGRDMENLLLNFLEEFLYLLDAKDLLVSKVVNLKIDPENFLLEATAIGDKAHKYDFTNDVKAITYNDMFIKEEKIGDKKKTVLQFVLDV